MPATSNPIRALRLTAVATVAALGLASAAATASAKQVVNYFGNDPSLGAGYVGFKGGEFSSGSTGTGTPGPVAVNQSGAGPAGPHDLYVVDGGGYLRPGTFAQQVPNNRIQHFSLDDNGTPALPYDDSYEFVSAWGADVVRSGGTGDRGDAADANFEICVVASECKAGVASAGNETVAGNGSLRSPTGIAVDQDTGDVYVADTGNHRVNVYTGDGTFLRSFGYDVTLSGPGSVPAPDERQEVTIAADGGKFSLSFRGETTGALGTARIAVTKEVREVAIKSGAFSVGQGFAAAKSSSATGAPEETVFPPGTTVTSVAGNTLTVSEAGTWPSGNPNNHIFGYDLDRNATAAEVEAALNALPTIGGEGGSVTVTGPAGGPYEVEFGGSLAETDVPKIEVGIGGLTLGEKYGSATVTEAVQGGAYEICVAADGDVCRTGEVGDRPGQLGDQSATLTLEQSFGLAVSPPDGNPATGSVFLADTGNRRVSSYSLDGSSPAAIGSAAEFPEESPRWVAVDSRGIVYASTREPQGLDEDNAIQRYDSEDANGGGVGFLAPIRAPFNEVQRIHRDATAGEYRLSFGGDTTADIPVGATSSQIDAALEALPSIGAGNANVGCPGDNSGNCYVRFTGAFAATDVEELVVSNGTTPPVGGTVTVETEEDGHGGVLEQDDVVGLAVDPDSDGAGPDADVLYSVPANGLPVQQLGPANAPGLTAPPASVDEEHATNPRIFRPRGIAVDESAGTLFVGALGLLDVEQRSAGVYVLGTAGGDVTASLDSLSDVTATTVTVHGTIDPNGPPDVRYRIEYSLDGSQWESTPSAVVGSQTEPQSLEVALDPLGVPGGLEPSTEYHVRIVVTRPFRLPVVTSEMTFTTLPAPPVAPLAETAGAPVRTAATAQLTGRVDPRRDATGYHFEYGRTESYGQTTPVRAAGSGNLFVPVAEEIAGLEPGATYHYRLVADNGNAGSPVAGGDMTVTTRASDEPLSHGDLPGPPSSDRAWEQVNIPDTSGNPAGGAGAFSDDGNRAVWTQIGGNPISDTGSANQFFAERTADGWKTRSAYPSRDLLAGANWNEPFASDDLGTLVGVNFDNVDASIAFFRISPNAAPAKLGEFAGDDFAGWYAASDDGSAVLARLAEAPDPAFPQAAAKNVYEVLPTGPRLVSLLPDGTPPSCGVEQGGTHGLPVNYSGREPHWISSDGTRFFFPSWPAGSDCDSDKTQLYMRDLDAGKTTLVSGPPVSGRSCGATFIRANADSVFFWTTARLAAEDSEPGDCASKEGGDVYRYRLGDGSLECLTCVVPSFDADVAFASPLVPGILVSEDGQRLYFRSPHRLALGAPNDDPGGIYRLDVAGGELAYVAPAAGAQTLAARGQNTALTPDGAVLVFPSDNPAMNPLGGSDNGGAEQFYRYDDRDGSLVCLSCPQDGSAPRAGVDGGGTVGQGVGPNHGWLSRAGDYVFVTPSALVGADQNTATAAEDPAVGSDVYEWRDGKLLLVTDGITSWPGQSTPTVAGFTPDGGSVFFNAAAQLTYDALDGYQRLYVARIGGGFEPPEEQRPCPLEVCQGTPKGAPDDPAVGSASFEGTGDLPPAATSCAASARQARRLSRQAKSFSRRARAARRRAARRRAAGAGSARRARALRRRASRLARASRRRATAARKRARAAKRCRRANANRRASR